LRVLDLLSVLNVSDWAYVSVRVIVIIMIYEFTSELMWMGATHISLVELTSISVSRMMVWASVLTKVAMMTRVSIPAISCVRIAMIAWVS
jgi:hypothetical protein